MRNFLCRVYKKEDDIYNREKEEPLDDEGNPGKRRSVTVDRDPGEDLDVPGAELDDSAEAIGEEDEENNYYSWEVMHMMILKKDKT
jgi:hypothetical protein